MKKIAKPWKTLVSKVILSHPLLSVAEDVVQLPNGAKSTYVRHAPTKTNAVIMVAVNNSGEVLIQREYSYPPNKVMWQLPGGTMEVNEDITTAALRELSEESGYSAKKVQILGAFYVHNRLSDKQQHIVLCTDLFENKLKEDADEFIETYWLSRQEIINKIKQGEFNNINLLAALNVWLHN